MRKPTYQFIRNDKAVELCTAYGVAQVVPVLCERCNTAEFMVLPMSLAIVGRVASILQKPHRNCRFKPMDIYHINDEWMLRCRRIFLYIAQCIEEPKQAEAR